MLLCVPQWRAPHPMALFLFHTSVLNITMRDSANFRRLRDSFMCRSSDYLKRISPQVPNSSQSSSSPVPVLAHSTSAVPTDRPGMLDVLADYSHLRLYSAMSCISYVGRHILSKLAPPSYLQALMSNPMGGVLT